MIVIKEGETIDLRKEIQKEFIEKATAWLREQDRMCMFEISMILGSNFIQDFEKAIMEE
jgi:hypothetical protein